MAVLVQQIAQAENEPSLPQENLPVSSVVTSNIAPVPPMRKKKVPAILIFLIIILFFFSATIGTFFFILSKDKKVLASLASTQVENFNNLQNNYQQIVMAVRSADQEENRPTSNQLLKVNSFEDDQEELLKEVEEKILGIEDTAELQLARKLTQLYQQATDVNQEISQQSEKVAAKIETFPLLITMNSVSGLTNKTADFTNDTSRILTFLDQDEAIGIELLAWINDFNLVLQMSITNNGSPQSVDKLEEKLKELGQIETRYNMITTNGLPVYLVNYKKKSTSELKMVREVLIEVKNAVADRDATTLILALEKLGLEAYGGSSSSATEWTTFWQDNETIQATNTLKQDWQKLEKASEKLF